jgi:ribonuclease VapC
MSKFVLDASAVLALLNNETGADLVQEFLPEAVISAINLAEIITRLNLLGIPESEIRKALDMLGLVIIPFDDNLAYLAGTLSMVTKPLGLSLCMPCPCPANRLFRSHLRQGVAGIGNRCRYPHHSVTTVS